MHHVYTIVWARHAQSNPTQVQSSTNCAHCALQCADSPHNVSSKLFFQQKWAHFAMSTLCTVHTVHIVSSTCSLLPLRASLVHERQHQPAYHLNLHCKLSQSMWECTAWQFKYQVAHGSCECSCQWPVSRPIQKSQTGPGREGLRTAWPVFGTILHCVSAQIPLFIHFFCKIMF